MLYVVSLIVYPADCIYVCKCCIHTYTLHSGLINGTTPHKIIYQIEIFTPQADIYSGRMELPYNSPAATIKIMLTVL